VCIINGCRTVVGPVVVVVVAAVAGRAAAVVVVGMADHSKVAGRLDMDLVSNTSSGEVVRPPEHLDTEAEQLEDGDHRVAGHSKGISSPTGDRYDYDELYSLYCISSL